MKPLLEIFTSFLRLGLFAFGGPSAHIAMMEKEFVQKKQWLTQDEFLDLLSLTHLIPGPNSTEMALHIGYLKAKGKGLIVAGFSFIIPATLMVLVLSYGLETYGHLPSVQSILLGINPIILALLLQVIYTLSKSQLKTNDSYLFVFFALILSFLGLHEVAILLLTGFVSWLSSLNVKRTLMLEPISLISLFMIFFKIGATLYGSGYVLLSYLKTEFLNPGYLSLQSILNAITLGQITPGPVFTTATSIGYQLLGLPGGVIATLGIFLPSFIFILVLHPLFPMLQKNAHFKSFLTGLKYASLALLVKVVFDLFSLIGLNPLLILTPLAFWIFIKTQLNPSWLILSGGIIGYLSGTLL